MPALYQPTASLYALERRAALYRFIRSFFNDRDFIEVSTPTLSRDVVVDRFVEAIPVKLDRCWQERDDFSKSRFSTPELSKEQETTFYLQTSPEFAMKRLVAAGMNAIFQMTPAYRRGDRGQLHNVEFTMLEWYRRHDNYETGRAFLGELVQEVSKRFFTDSALPQAEWSKKVEQLPFGDVFLEKTGLNPHDSSCSDFHRYADANAIPYPDSYADSDCPTSKDDWIDLIFSEKVQPTLGFDAATILYDYPASQSQLAKTGVAVDKKTGKPRPVSRRFELFVKGIELANGYDELLDASVLRERIAATSEERRCDGSPELPRESRLLAAMDAGLPDHSGCALGVDRLLCALLNTTKIDDVIAFPTELA
ncbi:MAG: EF-P lysine aminoacylase GenX [Thermoguttaceae bacterium]|nr:EF-P lysine aminoacylase GenX [Thermoguttaceae bacterium]